MEGWSTAGKWHRGERELGLVNVKLFASCARWSTSAGCRSSGCAEDEAGLVTRDSSGSVGATAHPASNRAPGLRAVLTELRAGGVHDTGSGSRSGVDLQSPL